MHNKEELIAAVDRAVEALGMVRRYLVEDTEEAVPASEHVGEDSRETAELPVYSSAKEMGTAAKIAIRHCREWLYRDVEALPVDVNLLLYTCQEEDRRTNPASRDAASYYLVSPEGAIGFTKNDGREVEWLFLPVGLKSADLPSSLKNDRPESDAEPELGLEEGSEIAPVKEAEADPEADQKLIPEAAFEAESEDEAEPASVQSSIPQEKAESLPQIRLNLDLEHEFGQHADAEYAPVPVLDFEALQELKAEMEAAFALSEAEFASEKAKPGHKQETDAAAAHRFCRSCGAQLKEHAHFCSRCGRKVEE